MTSADFTIADVLAWARTKPADEEYRYSSTSGCALCQFLTHAQIPFRGVGGAYWRTADGACEPLPEILRIALRLPDYTFGGLVARLEALLPAEPLSDTWTRADAYLNDIEDVARERVSA